MAGAEIVHGDLYAEQLQTPQRGFLDQHAVGDFQFETVWCRLGPNARGRPRAP